jgi:peptidoglycan/LPS O-acetylase OafA/YrhL
MRLEQLAKTGRTDNNFNLLRLLAAILVVFAHSFNLLNLPEPLLSLAPAGWGYVGVLIFFSISGFLVSRSWENNPKLIPFAIKRALRILPALIVALLLSALVLGPLVTTEALRPYFDDPETKAYIINNAMMQSDFELPAVFAHNIYPVAVNGSLWTLPLEVKAYIFIALIGVVGFLTRWRAFMIVIAMLAILICVTSLREFLPGAGHFVASLVNIQANPELVGEANHGAYSIYAELFAAFTVGAAMYTLRKWIIIRWELAVCAIAIWGAILVSHESQLETIDVVLAPYIVLCGAYLTVKFISLPSLCGDYSYGLYIYSFPVQQTLVYLFRPSAGWILFLVSMPVAFILAAASWHFIERPALDLKRRFTHTEQSDSPVDLSPTIRVAPVE